MNSKSNSSLWLVFVCFLLVQFSLLVGKINDERYAGLVGMLLMYVVPSPLQSGQKDDRS